MSRWRRTTLGDLVTLQRGYDLPEYERSEGSVPVYGSFGITGYHNKFRAPGPGVTVGRSGASFGVVNYSPIPYWPHNTVLFVTDFKGNNARFVSYLLKTIDFSGFNSGSAQPSLNRNFLYPHSVCVPERGVQERIASILSAYDDLIENNTRRINILEEMAQRLYREWFVNFRFPGHGKVRRVASELGPIPEGWTAGILRDVCESMDYGYTASSTHEPVGPKFLRITDIVPRTIDWPNVPYCVPPEKNPERYSLKEGDIVVARTGATTGYAKRLNKRHPLTVFASYLVRLRIKPEFSNLLYGVLVQSDDYKKFIKANWSGAAQPQANAQVLSSIPIVIPPPHLHQTFSATAEAILDLSENLQARNANLRSTRDLLLPKLISGQIPVEAAEEAMEQSA